MSHEFLQMLYKFWKLYIDACYYPYTIKIMIGLQKIQSTQNFLNHKLHVLLTVIQGMSQQFSE